MKAISIVGVPMDLGAARRGVDMGPSAFRVAGLGNKLRALGYQLKDRGNLSVQVRESLEESTSKAKFVEEIAQVLKSLKVVIEQILSDQEIPIVLGGDHSIAMGTVAGLSAFYQRKQQKMGLIWLDAHGDINTPETTLSGNIHGMPVAHILGKGHQALLDVAEFLPMVEPTRVAMIGLRDLDPGEKAAIKSQGIRAFTMRDVDERGMSAVMREAIQIASAGTAGYHLSFDVDSVDPSFAPGVGTPVPGGLTYREAHLAMEMAADSGKMLSMEVTEVNPVIDLANQTAKLATEMILSALGKRIL